MKSVLKSTFFCIFYSNFGNRYFIGQHEVYLISLDEDINISLDQDINSDIIILNGVSFLLLE